MTKTVDELFCSVSRMAKFARDEIEYLLRGILNKALKAQVC